ncbi:hypothetical protein [Ekhidna sp.]
MTNLQQELIDKYHSGLMSDSEMATFRAEVDADPSIKSEFDLQADIVNGLKEQRKIELKARLDAINVGPTWIEFVQQSALMKSLGGVMVASIIGTGIYFLGEKENENTSITITAPQTTSPEYVWELGNENVPVNNTKLEKLETGETIAQNTHEQIIKKIASQNDTEETVEESNQVADSFQPEFEAPSVENIEDEKQFNSLDLDKLPENTAASENDDPIDVQTRITKSNTIKYKYYDGKLFLNGDFDKAPYEILEINSSTGRRIYVYYLDNYYKVGIADKFIELPLVKNNEVVTELNLIRANK